MASSRVFCWFIAAAALAACGGAKEGGSCDQSGFLCADNTAALECRLGSWTKLPCRGAGGCERVGDQVKCDMSLNQAGDLCASTAEGKGMCSANGSATLVCRQGALVQVSTCRTCSVSGDQVICQP